jgi:predicted nucleic acid-binding protein
MTIVADASVALRWLFPLVGSEKAEELLRLSDRVIAPDLVIAEITNAAWKFVIFNSLPAESALTAIHEASRAFEELVDRL